MKRLLVSLLLATFAVLAQPKVADVEAAYNKLKDAESRKDPDGILEWATKTSAAARQITSQPKPAGADELEAWKRDTDYATQVDTYTEYSMQAAVASGIPPEKTVALTEALEAQNPKSQYIGLIFNVYLDALQKSGQTAKIIPAAESRLAIDPQNQDLLLVLADGYRNQKETTAKSTEYANRVIEVTSTKAKPENVSDADWEKRKNSILARAYWIAGINYGSLNQYKESDKDLRLAVPMIQGQNELLGPALFYLGVANYNLAKPTKDKKMAGEAAKFSDQSAAIKGPYQDLAKKNAISIRREFLIK
jgi:hypothetical protein